MSTPTKKWTSDGLAANFLEKFEKLRKNEATNTDTTNSNISGLTESVSQNFSTSNLFNNLAVSFNKNKDKIETNNNTRTRAEGGCASNLIVIDDLDFDDPPQDEPFNHISTTDHLKTRNSMSNISTSNLLKNEKAVNNGSSSDYEIFNKRTSLNKDCQVDNIGTSTSTKLSSSSSLYKLGSQVFDDLARNNPTINSVVDEYADNFKKRFLTKKKSFEQALTSSTKSKAITVPRTSSNEHLNKQNEIKEDFNKQNQNGKADMINNVNNDSTNERPNSIDLIETSNLLLKTHQDDSITSNKNDKNEMTENKNNLDLEKVALNIDTENSDQKNIPNDDKNKDIDKIGTTHLNEKLEQTNNNESNFDSNVIILEKKKVNNRDGLNNPKLKEKLTPMDLIYTLALKNRHLLISIVLIFLAYIIIMPRNWHYFCLTYSLGVLSGIILSALCIYLLIKLELIVNPFINSQKSRGMQDQTENVNQKIDTNNNNNDKIQFNEQIHSLLIQSAIFKENKNFDGVYKGWMNELREEYSPNQYFLNKTRSVYINLDGSTLRLQTTNSRIPKRAVCQEKIVCTFNKFRIYDLTDCQVDILPAELCRKRYWSKKYPLCLTGVKLLQNQYKPIQSPSSNSIKTVNSIGLTSSISTGSINSNLEMNNHEGTTKNMILGEKNKSDNLKCNLDTDKLILFARTDREKEEWFKLFKKSSARKLQDSSKKLQDSSKKKASIISNDTELLNRLNERASFSYSASNDKILLKLDDENSPKSPSSPTISRSLSFDQISANISLEMETQTENGLIYDSSLAFMNTFLIRLFADFFTHQYWISKIRQKIQNKLNTIKLPYFMESLNIINLDLGSVVPLIKQASEPWYDEKGLWVHLDIDYSGGVQILISTKLNLMKLKSNHPPPAGSTSPTHNHKENKDSNSNTTFSFKNDQENQSLTSTGIDHVDQEHHINENQNFLDLEKQRTSSIDGENGPDQERVHLAIIDSEAEDSPESSGDEYTHSDFIGTDFNEKKDNSDKLVETANTSKKLLNLVSKIASSNYFQKATENKYIKMAMENVSNCQLNLNVEVKKVSGKLALNIPPHPSDRIWYGFIEKPEMTLVATPQVGDKEVSYAAISDWIAEKLKQEFQKVLVFPNMDDFYIPILNSEVNYENW